ncbi:hypothetical protein [Thiococcus pfennigii]|uniref:hypothetical protein n=1 Tax=Thiococcus pfennigii TaxID=1057 RepID=UPI00190550BC|nr:hypothetical protein [Thiococcus pfennigii]MBK1701284.1 hypothetical protein [Thiococcus pfennigii]MBK1730313.1 hypothetical protein [Thiococcus pfennigii]
MTNQDEAPIGPATPELEGFVRKTLGCTCPAEVFWHVDESPREQSHNAGVVRRIAIGGRLLVYLVRAPRDDRPSSAAALMRGWVAAGLAERDAAGMNRLRIVVVLDGTHPALQAALGRAFEAARPIGDARLHLHLIDATTAAAVLPPA